MKVKQAFIYYCGIEMLFTVDLRTSAGCDDEWTPMKSWSKAKDIKLSMLHLSSLEETWLEHEFDFKRESMFIHLWLNYK